VRPEVTPPERATPLASNVPIPMRERYECRAVFAAPGASAPEAVTGGWIRLREGPRVVEPELLAAYTDSWPPSIFSQVPPGTLSSGVPTVDLTVHFRAPWPAAEDADDFALIVFRSRLARDGFVEEDGEVWTRGGLLLAQSRQLALVG
jgi:acyl-CoA thioesterase